MFSKLVLILSFLKTFLLLAWWEYLKRHFILTCNISEYYSFCDVESKF